MRLISFNLGFHSNLGRAGTGVISIRLTDPVHYRVIQPESLGRAANEADVASVFGGDEAYARVRQDGCGIVDRKGDEDVVLRMDQESWHTNAIEETDGGL